MAANHVQKPKYEHATIDQLKKIKKIKRKHHKSK